MHDIRFIRENPAAFDAALGRRGLSPMSADIITLDEKSRALKTEWQQAQARRVGQQLHPRGECLRLFGAFYHQFIRMKW